MVKSRSGLREIFKSYTVICADKKAFCTVVDFPRALELGCIVYVFPICLGLLGILHGLFGFVKESNVDTAGKNS